MPRSGGLHLHRAERADALVLGLAGVLATSQPDPFASEVVAVPARGVERWITQRLSHALESESDDGVCANVLFPPPAELIGDTVAAATGYARYEDPWAAAGVVWQLLDVVDASLSEPWCAPLRHYVEGDPSRRLATVQRLAGLFAAYGEQRPQTLRDWHAGRDTDGADGALAEDLRWQAELWRRLRQAIGQPSPAERLDDVCDRLREEPQVVDLPGRLSVFGPTRLTADQVAVLGALAAHRHVHVWLPHPSAVLWDRVATRFRAGERLRRRSDPTRDAADHPLLASLGRDSREMQLLLLESDDVTSDQHHQVEAAPTTLLGLVQHGIRHDEPPPGPPLGAAPDPRPVLDPADRSLRVHACHGPARQVDVMREVLLGLLEADPTLEPRDVLVMCPDIESFAPLISATFGLGGTTAGGGTDEASMHPGHGLRVRLADRSLRQTNPLLATLARLLELADARVTASQLLDFAALPPVRRRFRLDDDDLQRFRQWVSDSGVRWGIDAAHRAAYQMDTITQNTWQAGLDRILVGVTMAEERLSWLGLALPLDDVGSNDIDLAGRVAELVDRLGHALDALHHEQPLSAWLGALDDALTALSWVSEADAWQLTQARRELADVAAGAAERADRIRLTLGDVRAMLADRFRGRPTRAGFRTGNLTMCSMVPMRSVPHRVICLLGLDDGMFPRSRGIDGDDALAREPLVGERDRRSEDRQLVLDAILAAQEHLVMLYSGADERTNAPRPPAVPLGEILDVVDATVRGRDGRPAREHVVVRHPLQPFDARNFSPGALGTDGPFSFDPAGLAGARAAVRPRRPTPRALDRMLDPVTPQAGEVALDELLRFLAHPVREFLRQRLGVSVRDEESDLDDALSAELDPLGIWRVGDRWVRHRLGGSGADTVRQAVWRYGSLPPGRLGERVLDDVVAEAEPVVAQAAPDRVDDPVAVDVVAPLPSGITLRGTVNDLHGDVVRRTGFVRLGPKPRLDAWARVLALAVSSPGRPWSAVTIGRGHDGPACSTITAPPPAEAAVVLDDIVAIYLRGLRQPLPFVVKESHTYAGARRKGKNASQALESARKQWESEIGGSKDRHHQAAWGLEPGFDVLLTRPVDPEPAPTADDPTWFGALAMAVWWPLFEAEESS